MRCPKFKFLHLFEFEIPSMLPRARRKDPENVYIILDSRLRRNDIKVYTALALRLITHQYGSSYFFANSSRLSGGHPGICIPNFKPNLTNISLISFKDFLPKF